MTSPDYSDFGYSLITGLLVAVVIGLAAWLAR
jgi:hypothetical protein